MVQKHLIKIFCQTNKKNFNAYTKTKSNFCEKKNTFFRVHINHNFTCRCLAHDQLAPYNFAISTSHISPEANTKTASVFSPSLSAQLLCVTFYNRQRFSGALRLAVTCSKALPLQTHFFSSEFVGPNSAGVEDACLGS